MIRDWFDALAVYLERRLVIVFLMGFASGLPLALSGATLSIWLTKAGVSLAAVGLFVTVGTPYTMKFLWAPLVDRVPIPILGRRLGRRRSWMVTVQVALVAAIVALGATRPESAPLWTAVFALAVAFFSASQDIVIDAYRIEILDDDQQGAGAAMTQAGYRVGMIASGAGALFLADAVQNWFWVYAAMAALALGGLAVALLAPVPAEGPRPAPAGGIGAWLAETVVGPFAEFFTRGGAQTALIILGFILLYKFGDAFAGVMANPFYIRIGFSMSEIASVSKVFGVFATLAGVFIGGALVKRHGVMASLLACGLLQMFSNLMFAAQAAIGADVGFLVLTIGIENLSGGMGSAAFVAYLSLLCNVAYTGTQYALFSSFMAFGRTWMSASSGWIAEQTDWVTFFIISTFAAVPGLLMLLWMMKRLPIAAQTGRPAVADPTAE
ncbi:MAG: AmpG family muropeptide MFS transporter [Alphaproteobacteria bacterium]|nr:AmpG family muropeptide MFS transporter [Alphaproteobacteria bacterium]